MNNDMDILVARQPIYDLNLNVFSYELLYRGSKEDNFYNGADADSSTYRVIVNSFLDIGIEKLTDYKRGFINFTEKILLSGIVSIFPKDFIGVEILENINPTDEILNVCANLKEAGYMIVLDDFVLTENSYRLLEIADIIKMDFLNSTDEELRSMVKKYKRRRLKFLAEKIETRERFDNAKEWGYSYFQGYYFNKPTIMSQKAIKPLYTNVIKILEMLNKEECDLKKLAQFIEYDPAITFKILRLVNSVMYRGISEITNVLMALARIGLKELKICMMLVLINGLDKNKPNELIRLSIIRAKMAEEIVVKIGRPNLRDTFSLMGLISLMDVMLDVPLPNILEYINVSMDIENALLSPSDDIYSWTIRLIMAFEKAEWNEVNFYLKKLNISAGILSHIYIESVKWCDEHYGYINY